MRTFEFVMWTNVRYVRHRNKPIYMKHVNFSTFPAWGKSWDRFTWKYWNPQRTKCDVIRKVTISDGSRKHLTFKFWLLTIAIPLGGSSDALSHNVSAWVLRFQNFRLLIQLLKLWRNVCRTILPITFHVVGTMYATQGSVDGVSPPAYTLLGV